MARPLPQQRLHTQPTVAERDERLDAVESVEREVEAEEATGSRSLGYDALLIAVADLPARAVRICLVGEWAT